MNYRDRDLQQFGTILEPEEAQEPILPRKMRKVFLSWLTEIWAAEQLKEVGVKPRMRSIFGGKPGTGKTTLAHHLAARLGMRMLLVGPEKVNCRYMGASAEAIGELFDAVTRYPDPIVLFFDEFDSVAAERMNSGINPSTEQDHNLMINTLLSRMDRYEGIVIAASNFEGRLDGAVWRRFDLHVTLPLPGQNERIRILRRYFAPYQLGKQELVRLAESFETASPALMRQFCENIKRNIIVGPMANWDMGKRATIDRILDSTKPHADLGNPRLWTHKSNDHAIQKLKWPLSRDRPDEDDQDAKTPLVSAEEMNVVQLTHARKAKP
ncbi:MAG: ATP-binding protein [Rhizobiales bacterium]|nr:ATP-binding protein [Hyphomicrobiales bacterium]